MSYAVLAVVFTVSAVVLAVVFGLLARRGPHPIAVGATAAVLLALTAVFDTVMIGVGFFGYADAQLVGLRVGLAPIEDFAYPIAGAVLLPALWVLLRARRARATGSEAP